MSREFLQQLKERGDSKIKEFEEPISNMGFVGDYIVSYCVEDRIYQLYKTLAISRVDKEPVEIEKIMADLPDILTVFERGNWFFERRDFPRRGSTMIITLMPESKI